MAKDQHSTPIRGTCDERFERVRKAFGQNFEEGLEVGSCAAVYLNGEMVVDLWAGNALHIGTRPWVKDTVVPLASTGKVAAALCGLMLLDRGLIELDQPISKYWPEFSGGGKGAIPVRFIFSHSTGLPAVDGMPDIHELANWQEMIARLESQNPLWEPGTQSGYHSFSFGFLIGELVRRTTGKTLADFFFDEVSAKLDVDFTLGIKDEDLERQATVQLAPNTLVKHPRSSINYKITQYHMDAWHGVSFFNEPAWRAGQAAGNHGVGNARAMARMGNLLALGGTVDGTQFLKPETAALASQEQSYTQDLILGRPVRYGMGLGLSSKEFPLPWPKAMHWGGLGGSNIIIVPEIGASWSYIPNYWQGGKERDLRPRRINDAVIACLQELTD